MTKYLIVAALLFSSTGSRAGNEVVYPSIRNANAIVDAIRSRVDLVQIGFDKLASEAEIEALVDLGDCEPTQEGEIRKNMAVFNWKCGVEGSNEADRVLQLRFRDDGSLFALAVNPIPVNFAPTDTGMQLVDWPARENTAENFAKAVVANGDVSLGRLIPLTSLQRAQLQPFAGGEWSIVRYMSEREKREARRLLGSNIKIAEAPEDAIDIVFSAKAGVQAAPEKLSLYFDEDDRAVGVHMEDDLTRIAALPVKGI